MAAWTAAGAAAGAGTAAAAAGAAAGALAGPCALAGLVGRDMAHSSTRAAQAREMKDGDRVRKMSPLYWVGLKAMARLPGRGLGA